NENEGNPILIRDNSSNLEDGHLLVWDSNKKAAIDGGALNFVSKDTSVEDIEGFSTFRDGYTGTLNSIYEEITNLKDGSNLTIKQLSENSLGIGNALTAHTTNMSNPHNVNWNEDIKGDALSTITPNMDGTASAGTSDFVARADHTHPTDTTRAPVNHASTSTIYGVASKNDYGHVRVDDMASLTSTNPVQNKVITSYVDGMVKRLKSDDYKLEPNETISSIRESDGVIYVNKQSIQIN
ncbi:MAG: hypothetical protein IKT74_08615, partial [Bacteroidales bacterium]|nr:hypothetical protein [Bacteroidales bacterium]